MTKRVLLAAMAAALIGGPAFAEDIRVVVPYAGLTTNTYVDDDNSLDLEDDSLMGGLFFQWVNPELFQANMFLYSAPDIHGVPLWGGHLIGDYYPMSSALGKLVVGAGLEIIAPGVDYEDESSIPYIYVDVKNTIYVPYARVGHYFYFGSRDRVHLSVLPWAGAQYDVVRGEVEVVIDVNGPAPPPPPPITTTEDIKDEQFSGIAGLNLAATIMHFIELQAKYRATVNADDYLNSFDGLVNVFFTRNWGVSYRYKYSQSSSGSTSYHLGGVAYVF